MSGERGLFWHFSLRGDLIVVAMLRQCGGFDCFLKFNFLQKTI
jgi:hypothetical protein